MNEKVDFLSFFHDWKTDSFSSVWTGRVIDVDQINSHMSYVDACEPTFFGGSLVRQTHPVPFLSDWSTNCVTSGLGYWYEKIYHFEPNRPPSSDGDELQTEYFVELENLRHLIESLSVHRDTFNEDV